MNKVGRPLALAALGVGVKESVALETWGLHASALIKRAMQERGWGYRELSDALKPYGIKRSPAAINRRINRGNFTAAFALICLRAMGCRLELRREIV